MSSLKHNDRIRLEKFLEMGGGYVCNFSDRTFRDFVLETTGIDVYTPEYEKGGTSKANRLRTFWKKEEDSITAKLLKEILEYQKIQKQTSGKEFSYADEVSYWECLGIIEKLKDENVSDIEKPIEDFSDLELLTIIRKAENSHISGSLYQCANNEWQIRQQQKILEATLIKRVDTAVVEAPKNKGSHKNIEAEIRKNILNLLNDPNYPERKRSFRLLKKRFNGLTDDELRGILLGVGAMSYKGRKNEELWKLPAYNSQYRKSKKNNKTNPNKKQEEIFKLKSELYGVGVDLRGLFRYVFGNSNDPKNYTPKKNLVSKNPTSEDVPSKYWWGVVIPFLVFVGGWVFVEGKIPGILKGVIHRDGVVANIPLETTKDLRTTLMGSVFDFVSEIHEQKIGLLQGDFVENSKGKSFEASGTILEMDKFDDGQVWSTIRGTTTKQGTETLECHFNNSWEKTLKSMMTMEQKRIDFSGDVGYYTKGILVANNCKIINAKTETD